MQPSHSLPPHHLETIAKVTNPFSHPAFDLPSLQTGFSYFLLPRAV